MNHRFFPIGLVALCVLGFAGIARAGRFQDLTKAYESGPKASVVAATFIGGAGTEEAVAAAERSDGRMIVAGNAWGPQLPVSHSILIGKGKHSGAPGTITNSKGVKDVNLASPDRAGFILVYSANLNQMQRALRFDWGVATIEDMLLLDDNTFLVVGRTGPNAVSIKAKPNLAYIARMNDKGLMWIQTVDGATEAATRLWLTKSYGVYFRSAIKNNASMYRIGIDGKGLKKLASDANGNDVSDFHGVNPNTGEFYYGGDRNTNTGKEPWRQPFMYVYDRNGNRIDTLWNWPATSLRTPGYPAEGMVSDSSVRGVVIHPTTGELIINGWSDGGNSVFTRQPKVIADTTGKPATALSVWGMKGANSIGYVMRINPATWRMNSWCYWVCYLPSSGAPNFATIEDLTVVSDGSVAFAGQAATGLISTPKSFLPYKADGTKYGGSYVTVQTPNQSGLYFSSYLPGCQKPRVESARKGRLLVVSRTTGLMPQTTGDVPSPTINALQPKFGGGSFDGHIILLQMPQQ